MIETSDIVEVPLAIERLGVVLSPTGDPSMAEGILNPASARTRDGKLLIYPRCVAEGNVSRIGLLESAPAEQASFRNLGFALEPSEPYELRALPGGYGCEDPRVTFVPLLDRYVMCYTAYGPDGPRIAFALSVDGYVWERLGLADFSGQGLPCRDDKDAAFFPEPVLSPSGVRSFAFYHRPMLRISAIDGCAAVPIVLDKPPRERECIRIAYVPVDAVLRDMHELLRVAESALVLTPSHDWGRLKNGAGTPPVRVAEGWMSFYHAVDPAYDASGKCSGMRYAAGIMIHDAERPHIVRYHSPQPVLVPETEHELSGTVNNVVFPTAIDVPPGAPERCYDVYYGMADAKIGRVEARLGPPQISQVEESAA